MLVHHFLDELRFEWDATKELANRRKHSVEFQEGCEAFLDPFFRVVDAGTEGGEARQGVIGLTVGWKLVFVVYVEREEAIRLISARLATAVERRLYEDQ